MDAPHPHASSGHARNCAARAGATKPIILKGSQRGYGSNLAAHLTNARKNDHVEVVDIRGTAAENLHGALLEMEATAHGTKCKQPFFHAIVNPPESANLTREQFAASFDKIEADMGLAYHPRAAVFHEKNRQDSPAPIVKAKNMDHFKSRLRETSQE